MKLNDASGKGKKDKPKSSSLSVNNSGSGILAQLLGSPGPGPGIQRPPVDFAKYAQPQSAPSGGQGILAQMYATPTSHALDPHMATPYNDSSNDAVPFDDGSSDVDYAAMARKMYAPSLDYLNQETADTTKRGKSNDRQLANMYGALVNSIQGDAPDIAADYNDSSADVGRNTKNEQASINNTYKKSQTEQAALLARLGIQAAAPDTTKKSFDDQAFFNNLAGSSGKSIQNMLSQQRAGGLEYNTAQANISKQTGVDARATNQQNIGQMLSNIGGQRADLESQINQNAMQMQSDASKNLSDSMQQQFDNSMKQGDLDLRTAQFAAQQGQQQTPDLGKMDPYAQLQSVATQAYPGSGPQTQQNAINAITDTININAQQGKLNWTSPSEFVNAVMQRNPHAQDAAQLQRLAILAYQAYKLQNQNPGY